MPIRLTGMVSNMDTDSMVKDLVKAYSVKKDDLVKAQTKLSWKQTAWKDLNTKIHNLYKSLSEIKYESDYRSKKTTVSNPNAATIIAGDSAANGTQSLKIEALARAGYLTGGIVNTAAGGKVKGATTLKELGAFAEGDTDKARFNITAGGKTTAIEVDGTTTVDQMVKKLNDAGVNASFDEVNQRFFVNVVKSGKDSDFRITADNDKGLTVLSKTGLLTQKELTSNGDYARWANISTADFGLAVTDEVNKRVAALKNNIESLKQTNIALADQNTALTDKRDKYEATQVFQKVLTDLGIGVGDVDAQVDAMNADKTSLAASQKRHGELMAKIKAGETLTADESQELADLAADLPVLAEKVNKNVENLKALSTYKSYNDQIGANTTAINANTTKINDQQALVDGTENGTDTSIKDTVTAELNQKKDTAQRIMNGLASDPTLGGMVSTTAERILGEDAVIYLNNARYTSASNSFTVNGLTITAKDKTGTSEVSINTDYDVDGVYDKIKSFIKQYSELINEMDASYNAASSKGYEPLTDEEKEAMSEGDIEKWEKKVKDSLLRRDSTLGDVADAMKEVMMKSYSIGGKNYNLSSFGIETLGYFLAADNEKNAYHIFGDKDDSAFSEEKNKLKQTIASNPDLIEKFFSKLTTELYDTLDSKMKSIKNISSAYTVYEDKKMQSDYDDYTKRIKEQEEKLKAIEDKYYKQFAAMESAMSKLQSQTSALTNMLGGN